MTRTPSLPPRGEAHVWHGHGHGGDPDRDLALLSAEERRHCARLSLAADRCGFAAAWAHARRIVGGYLDQDPAALRIERPDTPGVRQPTRVGTDGGAPVFIGLTRAGRHWLLALAVGDPVGVDLNRSGRPTSPPSSDAASPPRSGARSSGCPRPSGARRSPGPGPARRR